MFSTLKALSNVFFVLSIISGVFTIIGLLILHDGYITDRGEPFILAYCMISAPFLLICLGVALQQISKALNDEGLYP